MGEADAKQSPSVTSTVMEKNGIVFMRICTGEPGSVDAVRKDSLWKCACVNSGEGRGISQVMEAFQAKEILRLEGQSSS